MKKLKLTLSILVVLALISGLFIKGLDQSGEISRQEFLFDTLCTITTYSRTDTAAIEKAFDHAAELHQLADFYDSASQISAINKAKAGESVLVNEDIMNMLCLAQDIWQKSGGAFDISIAPISQLWDFKAELPSPPDEEDIGKLLPLVNSGALLLDTKAMTVTKQSDAMKIDLGGVAKGYAADKAARLLKDMGVKSALLDFGGNIVAIGENPRNQNKKWRIGLQTPYSPTGEYSEIAEITEGAVVTSGTYQRYFEHNGTKYHHILDTKTGFPAAQSFDSVTVVSDSAALADCLATAIFVMGRTDGLSLAESYAAKVYFLP